MNKTKDQLNNEFTKMQNLYGSPNYDSVYGGGKENSPEIFLVFVNPTARNIATSKSWTGIKTQWLGTKQVWKFLASAGLFNKKLSEKIQGMKKDEWTEDFCKKVYDEVAKNGLYITNLAKCTQEDARPLPDSVFEKYRGLLFDEIELVDPKKVILFGNQVASVVLGKKIQVGSFRKTSFDLTIKTKTYKCYPVFYPVGNGFFNTPKAVEDLRYIASL